MRTLECPEANLPSEFAELLVEGGFAPENIRIIYEPFRIHGVAVGRK
jgi:hypothetical protein